MSRRVQGEGPVPAAVMLIGQRPGIEEVRRGRPFCGKSGLELDRYLRINSGIDRANVYVTNLVKTFDGVDEITKEEIEQDWPELLQELCAVRPRFIGLVGLYAVRAFMGDDFDLDWANGLHFNEVQFPLESATVMCLTHPAAGLHQPTQAIRVMYGFEQFGKLVRGEPLPPGHLRDPHVGHYSSITDSTADITNVIGVDTEGSVERPWCLSVSSVAGAGTVYRSPNPMSLPFSVLHNALHDLPVLESMKVECSHWTDTMMMAALLGTEPHGLKALARRHCGMVMQDYADVVREARREKALEYLGNVVEWMPLDPPKEKKKARPRKKKTLMDELESAPTMVRGQGNNGTHSAQAIPADSILEDDIPF